MQSAGILLIDDDRRLAEMVGRYLGQAGFAVSVQGTVQAGLQALAERTPDLILLDLMLPDGDGLDVCRRIRQFDGPAARVPILMLTARGETTDRVVGLEVGADDYLPKPFEPRELLARVRALLRRAAPVAVLPGGLPVQGGLPEQDPHEQGACRHRGAWPLLRAVTWLERRGRQVRAIWRVLRAQRQQAVWRQAWPVELVLRVVTVSLVSLAVLVVWVLPAALRVVAAWV